MAESVWKYGQAPVPAPLELLRLTVAGFCRVEVSHLGVQVGVIPVNQHHEESRLASGPLICPEVIAGNVSEFYCIGLDKSSK